MKGTMVRFLSGLCLLICLSVPITGEGNQARQESVPEDAPPALTPGQKLRITLPGRKEVDSLLGRSIRREEGLLLGFSGTSLGIENPESGDDTLWIAKASIVKLEMSYGEESHPYRGAAFGAACGFLGGLAAAAIETESCQGEFLWAG